MGSYYLLDEHYPRPEGSSGPPDEKGRGYASVSPHWILMVIRYKDPLTSSLSRLAKRDSFHTGDISQDDDTFKLTSTKTPLIVTSSCVQMDISSSKGSYTQNLNAVLKPGHVEFLSAIMPGDWCVCWMMNTKEKYVEVLDKIRKGQDAVNGFEDGLKFVGRVQDIRKVLMQSPTGLRTVQYNLSGVGFGELDSSIFFDPALARKETYLGRTLQDMNIAMNDIFETAAKEANARGGISVNKVIPALLTAFLGKGVSGPSVSSGGLDQAQGAAVATKEAPFSYVIPDGVAALLGVKSASKGGIFCYADILELIQGLQKYQFNEFPQMFFPTGTLNDEARGGRRTRHFTSEPLKGVFLPVPTAFNGKSVWNLLNEYLNPAINEMYTAMKYTPTGRVMPTLVVRQLPFSSPIMNNQLGDKVTAFHELPRWVGDSSLIRSLDVGRSDGARTNFVHIYAQPSKKTLTSAQGYQIVNWPPISDPKDMKRHGLRPHMGSIQAAATDSETGGPGLWMQIKSDFLLGQHMMLTGSVSMFGVTLPIVPGDNFEFDDILYHIESVNHHVEIRPDGGKTFSTQLTLTHGMRADVPKAVAKFSPERKVVDAKTHLRKSTIEIGESISRIKDKKKKANAYDRYGGETAFLQAEKEDIGGTTIEVGQKGENLDIYLYAGIDAEDNRELEPGVFIVDLED